MVVPCAKAEGGASAGLIVGVYPGKAVAVVGLWSVGAALIVIAAV